MKNMKSITRVMLFALLCSVPLTGCSERGKEKPTPEIDRTIKLKAGLNATKGSIDDKSSFTASIAGWESSVTVDYNTAAQWHSTAAIVASETASFITLEPAQLYNEEPTVKTYIKAWYPPAAPAADGSVIFGGVADGTTDVLFADEVVGSVVTTPEVLTFKHMLTQLKFVVVGTGDYPSKNNAVQSITIHGAELPVGLTPATGAVTYAAAADVALPGVTTSIPIGSTTSAVGSAAMVKPFVGNSITIDVKTLLKAYNGVVVTIDTDSNFIPGKAYTITLKFAAQDIIEVGSSVSEWKTGVGSGQTVD